MKTATNTIIAQAAALIADADQAENQQHGACWEELVRDASLGKADAGRIAHLLTTLAKSPADLERAVADLRELRSLAATAALQAERDAEVPVAQVAFYAARTAYEQAEVGLRDANMELSAARSRAQQSSAAMVKLRHGLKNHSPSAALEVDEALSELGRARKAARLALKASRRRARAAEQAAAKRERRSAVWEKEPAISKEDQAVVNRFDAELADVEDATSAVLDRVLGATLGLDE